MVKIESGIPAPTRANSSGLVGFGEALKACAVGDSFVWPSESSAGMSGYARYYGVRIITRKCIGGRRVWRVG